MLCATHFNLVFFLDVQKEKWRATHVHTKLIADTCPDFITPQELQEYVKVRDKGIEAVAVTYAVSF